MSAVVIKPLTEADRMRWDAFVAATQAATFCHRAGWKQAIERAFGHRTHFVFAERDGVVTGILPLTEIRSRLFGHALVSNAFGVYGGPVASDEESQGALERHAVALFEQLGADHLEFRSAGPAPAGWAVKDGLYVTFRREISRDHEKNLTAIPRKQRAVVRKGIANALGTRVGQDVGTLHRIYAESVRNLGTPVFPRRYFAALCEAFGDDAEILVVQDGETPIAAVLSFYFRDEVLPYYGGGTPAARDRAGNDIMYWEVMRRAADRGCRIFDFGRSKIDTGAYAFKKNWGFTPTPLSYAFKLRAGGMVPDVNPLNPKYRLFIEAWKRLPLPVANLIGPALAQGFGVAMDELLFLAHRIPFPPNKGDKIRAWHMLEHLARRYRIRLGCLIDDPHDRRYIAELERHCIEVAAVPIDPARQRLHALLKMWPGRPLSAGYFHAPALAEWVSRTIRQYPIKYAFLYSSPMMGYMPPGSGVRTVLDFVDVNSQKWREMAKRSPIPQRWIYGREARTLLAFDRRMAAAADRALLVTEEEARLFLHYAPEAASRTRAIRNGVDLDYFSPAHVFATPFSDGRPTIVFTGDMGYWPNVEAVTWFAREVMPRLRDRNPSPRFAIVGAHPTPDVMRLAGADILVTGRVEDVRPYIAHAACVVAPLRLARGVQNKVLEGMAMGKAVVATGAAEQGLGVAAQGAVILAETPEDMAQRIGETLDGRHDIIGSIARRIAEAEFSWDRSLRKLDAVFAEIETASHQEKVA